MNLKVDLFYLQTKFLNTSCESTSSVVSTVSYKSQLSSEEIASASLAEVVSQKVCVAFEVIFRQNSKAYNSLHCQ